MFHESMFLVSPHTFIPKKYQRRANKESAAGGTIQLGTIFNRQKTAV